MNDKTFLLWEASIVALLFMYQINIKVISYSGTRNSQV